MKFIIYSHIGERFIRYTNRPFSNLAYSVCEGRKELSTFILWTSRYMKTLLLPSKAFFFSFFNRSHLLDAVLVTQCTYFKRNPISKLSAILRNPLLFWKLETTTTTTKNSGKRIALEKGCLGQKEKKEKKAKVRKKYNHLLSDFLPGNLGEQGPGNYNSSKSPEKILPYCYKASDQRLWQLISLPQEKLLHTDHELLTVSYLCL